MKRIYKSEAHTQWLPISELRLDSRTNRDTNPSWVSYLAKNFDPDKLFILAVSERDDGTFAVIDGQHRMLALQEMGWGDQKVECKIFKGLSIADEARLFVEFQQRKSVSAVDKFLKMEVAGDHETCEVARIVRASHLTISKYVGPGNITAVAALQAIYRGGSRNFHERHPEVLERTLNVLRQAWGDDGANFNGKVMEGLGLFLHRYWARSIDVERLTERLASLPSGPIRLLAMGRAAGDAHSASLGRGVAGVITDLYNKGLRKNLLPDWWS